MCHFSFFTFRPDPSPSGPIEPPRPPMKKQDLNLQQLREHDGNGKDGRICVAVNGKVYDVTKGKKFYGPGKISRKKMWN